VGDLAQGQLLPEDEARILELAAEPHAGILAADFETKRYLLERLDVRGVLREDDASRWLDTNCAVPGWEFSVVLDTPGADQSASHTSETCARAPLSSRRRASPPPDFRCNCAP
jgi:hypothetical protein